MNYEIMDRSTIFRFVVLGALWLLLVVLLLSRVQRIDLMTIFWIVASGIIVFVPLYKKYVKDK